MGEMVHVAVTAAFRDKETGKVHRTGDELDVTPERLEQLNACGPEQNHVPLVRELSRRVDGADGGKKPAAKSKKG